MKLILLLLVISITSGIVLSAAHSSVYHRVISTIFNTTEYGGVSSPPIINKDVLRSVLEELFYKISDPQKNAVILPQEIYSAGKFDCAIKPTPEISMIYIDICWVSSHSRDDIYFLVPVYSHQMNDVVRFSVGHTELYCGSHYYVLNKRSSQFHDGIEYGFFNANENRTAVIQYDVSYECSF